MTPIQLAEITRIGEWLKEQCGDDEALFHDMTEAESPARDILERIHDRLALDEEVITGIKARMTELNERLRRIDARKDASRKAIGMVLRAAGLKKAELIEATISVREGKPKLVINDPDAVPDTFRRIKSEPNKTAINDAYSDSDSLPNWLHRAPPEDTITIRSR